MFKAISKMFNTQGSAAEVMRIYSMHWVPREKAAIVEDALSDGDHAFEPMGTTSDGEQIICVHRAQKCYIATIEINQLDVGLGKALIIKDIAEIQPENAANYAEQLREL